MSTTQSPPLKRGTYSSSTTNDLRSPCPLVNCLANHGYIPRDGRNVRAGELVTALNEAGLSYSLRAAFSHPLFLEHVEKEEQQSTGSTGERQQAQAKAQAEAKPGRSTSFVGMIVSVVRNPWSLFSRFGMRRPGQTDSEGNKVINLDQLALPGVVEHDISLSRRDHQQGDNISRQPDLVAQLLDSASSDGGRTMTAEDLAGLRRLRIEQQRRDNPAASYGEMQHQIACAEIALILKVFGDGTKVPCEYVRALFQEERLPIAEGWKRRRWWTLGIFELQMAITKVKNLIGIKV